MELRWNKATTDFAISQVLLCFIAGQQCGEYSRYATIWAHLCFEKTVTKRNNESNANKAKIILRAYFEIIQMRFAILSRSAQVT